LNGPIVHVDSDRTGHDIIVLGGSLGSIEAVRIVLSELPADLPAAVFVVIHTSATGPYLLPDVLQRDTRLRVVMVENNLPIVYGRVYAARPDLHLLVESSRIRVVFGPKENCVRPAIDPLYRSAAWTHGPHVIAALMSGVLADGVAGLWDVHCCGGITMVQDPASARFPEMIQNALAAMVVDQIDAPEALVKHLVRLVTTPPAKPTRLEQERIGIEHLLSTGPGDSAGVLSKIGELSANPCPICGGPLWRLPNQAVEHYRCQVGHAYSRTGLFGGCWEASERTLYSALRMLEENARIGRRMLKTRVEAQPNGDTLREQVDRLEEEADTLRRRLGRKGRSRQEIELPARNQRSKRSLSIIQGRR
jgi:two-component system, chemotaxis family, protein-glutamate methylesterase/glutaminase